MKVVLSQLFYPVTMGRYFEAALHRRKDVELYTIGPYFGAWIPWNNGMTLLGKYAKAPDQVIPQTPGRPPAIAWAESLVPFEPDLWLQIDAGFHFYGKPTHGQNFIVGTDPHVLDYDAQRVYADKFFCMQKHYSKPGDIYLPYAYDPIWHRPEAQPRRYDAALIGLHYEQRNQWVAELRRRGLNVFYDLGPCFDEARAIYNQAGIGLNWSSLKDLTARVFELTAMGLLAVVNEVPDLTDFFTPGQDLTTFETLGEAVETVIHFHENPDEARQMAKAGRKAVAGNTWDARIEQILSYV